MIPDLPLGFKRLSWGLVAKLAGAGLALAGLAGSADASELRGHGGPVRAIAVSSDGSAAITGSFDATAIVWSLASGTAETVFRFHDGQVNAVAALPGGSWATAGEDGRIAVWQGGQGTPIRVLEGHTGPVVGLAVAPDGGMLASASWDRTVRLWPLPSGEARVLQAHKDSVNAVAFTSDGELVSGGYDGQLIVWPSAGHGAPRVFSLPTPLNTLAALPNGRVAVGGADGRLRIVDRTGSPILDAPVAETPVIALAASPDGSTLAAAGLKGAIALLDAQTLGSLHQLLGPGLPVWSLAFTSDGKFLLSGGSDRLVRRWNLETGEHVGAIVSSPADPLAIFAGDRGAEVFRACVACHTLAPGDGTRAGPTLHGIFGRKIASVAGFPYSAAFRGMDIVWTPETVAKLFEVGPAAFTPGTKMPEQRITDREDRAALIRFLQKATAAQP